MVYRHAALIEVQPDKKVILKAGKQESDVKIGKEVVEEDGKKMTRGKKYKLIKNVELPFVMSEDGFEAWKKRNKEVKEKIKETQKSIGG